MTHHPYADRLIYAADMNFKSAGSAHEIHACAEKNLYSLIKTLGGTGITIKANTLARVLGIEIFSTLEEADLKVFADYKLFDVQDTIENDLSWLQHMTNLDVLTIAEAVKPEVFTLAAKYLSNTIIAPVNPLTDLSDNDFERRGEGSRKEAVKNFFLRVDSLHADGVISSPRDIHLAPHGFINRHTLITPAIRPSWFKKEGDNNAINSLNVTEAFQRGAGKIVVGSPIRHKGDMLGNTLRILDEIGDMFER